MITLKNVTGGYTSGAPIVKNLTLEIEKGQFFALLGPNGSGKTTVVRLVMGVLGLLDGSVFIDGKKIEQFKPKELARKVAVLSQENQAGLDFTVREIVQLGRYPHQKTSLFREYAPGDEEVVERVMRQTNCWEFRDKLFGSLSGGEKQRVLLAKALAQEPDILLLDEPTNHLDVRHTMELLDLMKTLQKECGLTILAILHDLNLASLYADDIGLLNKGVLEGTFTGLSNEVQQLFSSVYGVPMHFNAHPVIPKCQVFYTPAADTDMHHSAIKEYAAFRRDREDWHIVFSDAFRTITAGRGGKGLAWEHSWGNTAKADGSIVFSGNAYLFGYSPKQGGCLKLDWDKGLTADCEYFLIIAEQGNQIRAGLLTAYSWDDSVLMNIAMRLTAGITGLYLEKGFPYSSLEMVAVGTARKIHGEGMQSWNRIERLLAYAADNFMMAQAPAVRKG